MSTLTTILSNPLVKKLALNKLINYLKEEKATGVSLTLAPEGAEMPFTYELTYGKDKSAAKIKELQKDVADRDELIEVCRKKIRALNEKIATL